jgi:tetratricopeptide (TPR) repeat protein
VLAVDPEALAGKLLSIPDGENALLRLANGRRTVTMLLIDAGIDRAEALASLGRLLDAGVLRVVPPGSAAPAAEPNGPDGAEWFAQPQAHPEEQPEAAPDPSTEPGSSPAAPGESPGAPGGTHTWAVVAAVALGAVLLAGTWWTRTRRDRPRPATAAPSTATAEERPGGGAAPPALSITEPATSTVYREAMEEVGARYQRGDLAGAAAAARRAIDVDPSIGAGWLALGEVQLAAGDRGAARDAFVRYLALEPEGRHAPRIRALLARLRP